MPSHNFRNLIWWSNTISILQKKLLMPLLYFVAALSIGIWWLLFTFPDSYHFKNDFNSILRPTVIMSYNFTGPFWHVLVHHKDSILLPTESAPAEKTYFLFYGIILCALPIFSAGCNNLMQPYHAVCKFCKSQFGSVCPSHNNQFNEYIYS